MSARKRDEQELHGVFAGGTGHGERHGVRLQSAQVGDGRHPGGHAQRACLVRVDDHLGAVSETVTSPLGEHGNEPCGLERPRRPPGALTGGESIPLRGRRVTQDEIRRHLVPQSRKVPTRRRQSPNVGIACRSSPATRPDSLRSRHRASPTCPRSSCGRPARFSSTSACVSSLYSATRARHSSPPADDAAPGRGSSISALSKAYLPVPRGSPSAGGALPAVHCLEHLIATLDLPLTFCASRTVCRSTRVVAPSQAVASGA